MVTDTRKLYPGFQQFDQNGSVISNHISLTGGKVDLSIGLKDDSGFYITIAPLGTAGLLKVILYSDTTNTPIVIPFYKGWNINPILLKQIVVDAGNTVTEVYWGK